MVCFRYKIVKILHESDYDYDDDDDNNNNNNVFVNYGCLHTHSAA